MKKITDMKQLLDDIYSDLSFPCFTFRQHHAIGIALCTLEDYFSKINSHDFSGYCNYLVRLQYKEKTVDEGKEYSDMALPPMLCEKVLISLQKEFQSEEGHKGKDGALLITMQVIEDRMGVWS